jgi:Arc/MetJ-type ribon-helix-helix transcriptional regulator
MEKFMNNLLRLPERQADPEKITINVSHVDLGRIDLLVREGFYANRSDFIRTAIRNQLTAEAGPVKQSIERYQLELGLFDITRADLEELREAGEKLNLKIVGLARFSDDVTPDLARATIATITVLGAIQASKELKAALKDRMA